LRPPELDLFEKLKTVGAVKPTAPTEGSSVEKSMAKDDPDFSTPVTIRNLFHHQDAHPVVLDLALLKAFSVEWMLWESQTVWSEVKRIFKTDLSEHARAKIQAVRSLHVSDGPWEHWQVFEKVCQALNNNLPRADVVQPPTIEQLFVAVDIMEEVREKHFSDEVRSYVATAVLHDDILYVPPPLDFAQAELSQPQYECLDCGNFDSALFHDGLCDTCTNKFDPEHNLSFRPGPDAMAKGKGKNLKLTLRYNPDPVEKRWKELEHMKSSEVELKETPEDVQVAKLLMARDYLNIRRRQLAEQLTSLKSWMGST
jgi:hypothetical protein